MESNAAAPYPYAMREPCRWCLKEGVAERFGSIHPSGGQDVVRCARCHRQCYNAPKSETGKPQRQIKSRPDLKEGQRERILKLDGNRCFLCGRGPSEGVYLHIAHALSRAEGLKQGVPEKELDDDGNLFAACEECNLQAGAISIEPKLFLRLIIARTNRGRQR